MKKAIVCLLTVLLVVSSLALIAVPPAASQQADSNLKVIDYNWYLDMYGNLIAIGEVQNTGTSIYSNITLAGTVSTADGVSVESYGMVWVTDMLPQQKAPFYMQFDPTNTFYGTFINVQISKIDFLAYPSAKTASYLYPDVTVSSSQGSVDTDGTFYVSGTVQNSGTQNAKDALVVATFYNSEGKIAGVGVTNDPLTPNPIAPSGSANFKVGAWDLNQTTVSDDYKIATFSVLVQVTGTTLQGDAPVITATPTPGPVNTGNPGSSGSSQSGTNNGADQTNTYIAVIIVVIAVAAVAAFLFIRRSKSAAKKTPPKPIKNAKRKKK